MDMYGAKYRQVTAHHIVAVAACVLTERVKINNNHTLNTTMPYLDNSDTHLQSPAKAKHGACN